MAKILVVDDDPVVTKLLETRLRANHYEVLTAADGEEGLHVAKNARPDLIILDVMLPKINGSVVCGILKYDEDFKSIPILMLTVKSRQIDRDIGQTVKADAYVTKPFDMELLLQEIEKLIKPKKSS